MNPISITISSLALVYCVSNTLIAQTEISYPRLQVAASVGYSFGGPGRDIEDNMTASGLNDDVPPSFFGNDNDRGRPKTFRDPGFALNAGLLFSESGGVLLKFSLADNRTISGYESAGLGNSFILESNLYAFSILYQYALGEGRHLFTAGPAYFSYSAKFDNRTTSTMGSMGDPDNQENLLGFNAGYTFNVISKPRWFVGLGGELYLPFGSADLSSFEQFNNGGGGPGGPQDRFSSTFQALELNQFTTGSIHLTVGVR